MDSPKCCNVIMRCYHSVYLHYGNWCSELTHFFQCMKCGKLKNIKYKKSEVQDEN